MRGALKVGACLVGYLAMGIVQAETPVTYLSPGKNLKEICKDLSALTGQSLKVSSDLQNEILAIRVAAVSPTAIEEKIAHAVHGAWNQSGIDLVLRQANADSETDLTTHTTLITAAYQKALDLQAKAFAAQPAFDADQASRFASQVTSALSIYGVPRDYAKRLDALEPRSPSRRAITRLLTSFQASELAALPLRMRVVYSNEPNHMQRPLSEDSLASAKSFIQEQTLWSIEERNQKAAQASQPGNVSLPDFLSDTHSPSGTPAKVLVGVYRESENGRVRFDMKVADSAGNVICHANGNLRPKFDPAPLEGVAPDDFPKSLQISPEDFEMAPDGFRKHPIDETVKQKILNSTTTDPLSIGYGTTLVNLADGDQINLVANLSDQLIDGVFRDGMSCTENHYLGLLATRGQSVNVSQGWLLIAPQDFYFSHNSRADRGVLEQYLRDAQRPDLSVERQAASAVALPDPLDNYLPSELYSTLKRRMIGLQNVAILKFYGTLGEDEIKAASSSAGLRLSQLSGKSLEYLNEIAFGEMGDLLIGDKRSGINRDPTECLANGFSPEATLTMHAESTPSIFDLNRDRQPFSSNQGSITPGELAFLAYAKSHPAKYPREAEEAFGNQGAHYTVGVFTRYDLLFRFSSAVTSNGELEGREIEDDKMYSAEELPSEFRSQIEAKYAEIDRDEKNNSGTSAPVQVKTATP